MAIKTTKVTRNSSLGKPNLQDQVEDMIAESFVFQPKKIGGKKNPEHSRTMIDKDSLALVVTPTVLRDNSAIFGTIYDSNRSLFDEVYKSVVTNLDNKFKKELPTDINKLMMLKPGLYKVSEGKERIYIAFDEVGKSLNFTKLQTRFSTSVKQAAEQGSISNKITKEIEDLLVLKSFTRVFKGGEKENAVAEINSRIAAKDKQVINILTDAGFKLPLTKNQLSGENLSRKSEDKSIPPDRTKYDALFAVLTDAWGAEGLESRLQDIRVGLELGHIGGVSGRAGGGSYSSPIEMVARAGLKAATEKAGIGNRHVKRVQKLVNRFNKEKFETNITKNFNEQLAFLEVVFLVPQSFAVNNADSIDQSKVKRILLKNLYRVGITGESSPSILQFIEGTIISSILGKSFKKYRDKKKSKEKLYRKTTPRITPSKKIKRTNKKSLKKLPKPKSYNVSDLDVLNLKKLINEMLAKNIEQDMDGAGGKLNYQTGRFADSAHLLTLTRNQAGVLAGTYTYMRDPYDVFLPGHKMGTPKRDPRIYVEGAARRAAMTILKNKFPGIALNLQ